MSMTQYKRLCLFSKSFACASVMCQDLTLQRKAEVLRFRSVLWSSSPILSLMHWVSLDHLSIPAIHRAHKTTQMGFEVRAAAAAACRGIQALPDRP